MSNTLLKSALLVLSPIAARHFDTDSVVHAATVLKQQGIERADITMDPRSPIHSRHAIAYPLVDFRGAANRLSDNIFRPMLGRSNIVDFSNAVNDEAIIRPTLQTLSTVGSLFTQKKNEASFHGKNIGFVFYLALHAQTAEHQPYSHLVYPDLTQNMRNALTKHLNTDAGFETNARYGVAIDLRATRAGIAFATTPETPMPARSLH